MPERTYKCNICLKTSTNRDALRCDRCEPWRPAQDWVNPSVIIDGGCAFVDSVNTVESNSNIDISTDTSSDYSGGCGDSGGGGASGDC